MPIAEYEPARLEDRVNISPSSIFGFFQNKNEWYKKNITGELKTDPNTYLVTGTVIHYMCEMIVKDEPIEYKAIEDYVGRFTNNFNVDYNYFCRANLDNMKETLIEFFERQPKPDVAEHTTVIPTRNGFSLGGSVDAIHGDTITDYKSMDKMSDGWKLSWLYQMLCYAICERANGREINYIRVVKITRPDMVGKVSESTNKIIGIKPMKIRAEKIKITDEMIMKTKDMLSTIMDTIQLVKDNPEIENVLLTDNPFNTMEYLTKDLNIIYE